jgi:predicted  nucleic acid-binding Zn-ribbon protein
MSSHFLFSTPVHVLFLSLGTLLCITLLSGCGTIKKWSCNGNNWYELGYQASMNGERLDSIEKYRSCKDVQGGIDFAAADKGFKVGMAKYCTQQTAFEYGREGKPMNFPFCDQPKFLETAYNKGILAYCEPGNALAVGRSGAASRDVCPDNMKAPFVKKYREGRKEYLQVTIRSQTQQIQDLEYEISNLETQRASLSYKIQLLPQGTEKTIARVYDPERKTYIEKEITQESPEAARQRQRLSSEMDTLNSRISNHRGQQQALRHSLRSMEDELRTF